VNKIAKLIFTLPLLIAFGSLSMGQGVHYEVFLLAGQSNMDGRGIVKDLTGDLAHYATPQPNVRINFSAGGLHRPLLVSKGIEPLRPGFSATPLLKNPTIPTQTFGPEVSFGDSMAQALPGRQLLLVKFAEGGSNLREDWNPNQKGKLYEQFIQFVRSTKRMIEAQGNSCQIRGMLWHQGESDFKSPEGVYQAELTNFIGHVRSDLELPNLPFLMGQVYDNSQRAGIATAQLAVTKLVPNTAVVESKGLTTLDKGTHFDAKSQIELGNRFAREMLRQLQGNTAHAIGVVTQTLFAQTEGASLSSVSVGVYDARIAGREILNPKPLAEPRITGASIFGV
jgi:hypothetical protein